MKGLAVTVLVLIGIYGATSSAIAAIEVGEPEAATGLTHQRTLTSNSWLATTANPLASQAAAQQLKQGGSVIDAAIAAQAMLTLTEPQSSGIGGGFFLLMWDNQAKQLVTLDARETAPKLADASQFIESDGKPSTWHQAIVGGRGVGVPGTVQGLWQAHQRFGKLPWRDNYQAAITQAQEGFLVSPRLHKLVAADIHPGLRRPSTATDYFLPNGKPIAVGSLKKNPELAQSLTLIANYGPAGFYQGKTAKAIVKAVQQDADYPGRLQLEDLANYRALWRQPICHPYRSYSVCGMGPPSSGATTIGQMLSLLEPYKLSDYQIDDPQFIHLFSQASRLAYADRNQYIADPDFTSVPVSSLLKSDYLKQRGQLIDVNKDMGKASAGLPALGVNAPSAMELPSTSHLTLRDQYGNILSMTTSIEMGFGSSIMVQGFLLNNQLTDFTLAASSNDETVANRLQPLKRPRSSMAPTMVFDSEGEPLLALGSPGGSRIINYVVQAIIASVDWQMPLQDVLAMPRITNRNDYTALERGTALESLQPALESKGHKVRVVPLNSGIQAIKRTPSGWKGSADPRREGKVIAP
ncbi:gamma-glutamyltransferase [Paraferrimonas haliotis]|uniref:Glutathione hydrolase proenzyme n=1 Tax=Paraferrimonas haliotis TaxID=2013866 RepID=A0AA37WX45_9GAMM|nr:gamma-glutamyltransferase [Paraferrimonas haliotis]GLS84228.1 gamma-glutamyltranspeptidase [Paraferrimonas haliotis]